MDQQRIGDRYELGRRIGRGGMSRVYLARDRVLGREVAVKVLDAEEAADPSFVERFRREARAAASLNHPNVVSVYDWGAINADEHGESSDCLYYMVMEYVPGGNLKDAVRRRGPLPEDEALRIGIAIADALDAAHRRGIVHRDVKPHNVLLDTENRPKVADFGIAHAAGLTQLTETGAVSGTAHYISPEQAQQRHVDGRSDLYSLGVVLYELLTGREPFQGDSLVEVALKHVQEEPVPPRRLRPAISAVTEAVVLKALAKEPALRYQSAADMRDALSKALNTSAMTVAVDEETQPVTPVSPGHPVHEAGPTVQRRVSRTRTRTLGPPPGSDDSSRRMAWLMAVPALLLLLGVVAVVVRESSSGPTHTSTGARTPTALRQSATETLTPRPRRQTTRASPNHPQPRSVGAPPPTATSQPAATSTPVSVPTSPPAPVAARGQSPPAVTATPEAVPPRASDVLADRPEQAVETFYSLVAHHQFDEAATLWTANMIQTWSVQSGIVERWSKTRQLTVQIDGVRQDDPNHATVWVTLHEQSGTPPQWQTLVGRWLLVRSDSGWLLDHAYF